MRQPPRIETRRLLLRPLTPRDARDVQRLAGDREVADTLRIPYPYAERAAKKWISTLRPDYAAGKSVALAITLRATGELIGTVNLGITPKYDLAKLGFWVGKPYWNQGFCTEAGRAMLAYAFTELGLNRVHASHVPRNQASGRVLEKLGMRREGVARQHTKRRGEYEDLLLYGILKEEWRAQDCV
ncbi:GNAT family N-acetyltransferase [Verrucomicrobiota bacterium]